MHALGGPRLAAQELSHDQHQRQQRHPQQQRGPKDTAWGEGQQGAGASGGQGWQQGKRATAERRNPAPVPASTTVSLQPAQLAPQEDGGERLLEHPKLHAVRQQRWDQRRVRRQALGEELAGRGARAVHRHAGRLAAGGARVGGHCEAGWGCRRRAAVASEPGTGRVLLPCSTTGPAAAAVLTSASASSQQLACTPQPAQLRGTHLAPAPRGAPGRQLHWSAGAGRK